jgi:lysophospholipase L1-like esterase
MPAVTVRRYVAIGDSTTEGVGDDLPDGSLQGWADRFAAALSRRSGTLHYANLAIRGRTTAQIRREQAAPALALQPDLISAVVGVNDLVATQCDVDGFSREVDALFAMLRRDGATVLSSTLPDLSGLLPAPRQVRASLRGRQSAMNAVLTGRADEHGVLLLPLADMESATDRRVWRPDRLHPNPVGHALLADGMLHLLDGRPITVSARDEPGYGFTAYARAGLLASAGWVARYLAPRTVRRLRGKSSGDGRVAKLPAYTELVDGQVIS